MLNPCAIVRPLVIVAATLAMLSIVAPEFFESSKPYLAAGAVLLVPIIIYRWWNERYNPGCSVRFSNPPRTDSEDGGLPEARES